MWSTLCENLKGTILAQWQFFIQEKFLSNDYFAKECSSEHFSQACCRQTVVKETSSPGTFLPHAVLQPRECTEYLVHDSISSVFYWTRFALVRKMDSSSSNTSVLSVITSIVDMAWSKRSLVERAMWTRSQLD